MKFILIVHPTIPETLNITGQSTRWFKYDRDCLCVNLATSVPVIFEPPCIKYPNS